MASWNVFELAIVQNNRFDGTDFSYSNFKQTDLSSSTFKFCRLDGATIELAILTNVQLHGTIFWGVFYRFAKVAFTNHGQCGRELIAIRQNNQDSPIQLFCGCFTGTEEALRDFIAKGSQDMAKTRLLALETVLKLLDVEQTLDVEQ